MTSPNGGAEQRSAGSSTIRMRYRTIHGYRSAFRMAGKGRAILLIHGIGDSSDTWRDIMPGLARNYRVIAPDLLGHGASDKPRTDYSLPSYANGMRDLLGVRGIEQVTLVGHSLGGAVAMQFAYQFPERVERLVLVGTGGISRGVTPLLRAATLPGAELALMALRLPTMRTQLGFAIKALQFLDVDLAVDAPDVLRVVDALPDGTSRNAFIRTLRAVVDWKGQVGTMLDRCYLAQGMPTMLLWGGRDQVVPSTHAGLGHVAMPGSRLEIFEHAGHFPFRTDPQRFENVLRDFISTTEPAPYNAEQWRRMLRTRHLDPPSDRARRSAARSSAQEPAARPAAAEVPRIPRPA